jgi:hypothetical protein
MTPQYPTPTVLLWPEETATGTVYRPGNTLAVAVTKLIGKIVIQDFHLPLIEACGFQIAFHNGQPLPYPKGYRAEKLEDPIIMAGDA